MSKLSRDEYIDKIKRYKLAISNTNSPHLKRDYQKAIRRMQRELRTYDMFQKQSNVS